MSVIIRAMRLVCKLDVKYVSTFVCKIYSSDNQVDCDATLYFRTTAPVLYINDLAFICKHTFSVVFIDVLNMF